MLAIAAFDLVTVELGRDPHPLLLESSLRLEQDHVDAEAAKLEAKGVF